MRILRRFLILSVLTGAFLVLFDYQAVLAATDCRSECAATKAGCVQQAGSQYGLCDIDCRTQGDYERDYCYAYNCYSNPPQPPCSGYCDNQGDMVYQSCKNDCSISQQSEEQYCEFSYQACIDACP